MTVQTACTVKLKIPESSPGRAEEDFQVPARRTASRSSTELRESLFWCPVWSDGCTADRPRDCAGHVSLTSWPSRAALPGLDQQLGTTWNVPGFSCVAHVIWTDLRIPAVLPGWLSFAPSYSVVPLVPDVDLRLSKKTEASLVIVKLIYVYRLPVTSPSGISSTRCFYLRLEAGDSSRRTCVRRGDWRVQQCPGILYCISRQ